MPLRVAVLISGTGSNLKAILDAGEQQAINVEVVQVISNKADAGGLGHARRAGVAHTVIDKVSAARHGESEDQQVARCLREAQPDLVVLSGYMRIVGAELCDEFSGRMINQHPSLLPKFKGLNTYTRVLAAGDTMHGASVHFVSAELDGGPVIAQVQIPVLPGDQAADLAARLGPLEHQLLLAVLKLFCANRISLQGASIYLDNAPLEKTLRLEDHELVP